MKHKHHNKKRKAPPSNPLKPHHQSKVTKSNGPGPKGKGTNPKDGGNPNHNSRPVVPFEPTDDILLVGEGDFSFTHSIITSSHIASSTTLTTSTNESESVTYEKYPQTEAIIAEIKSSAQEEESEDGQDEDTWEEGDGDGGHRGKRSKPGHKVFFNVDVTKKYPKGIRNRRFDAVIFNFPHTGGLTSDFDRQIRANQELLLSFLTNTKPILKPTGTIVITLFDGLPYSRWNLRELAKSIGLQSRRSFKFDVGLYPGYKHARTIGNRDREGDWKGEERSARTYVFEVARGGSSSNRKAPNAKGKKAGKKEESDDDDDN
ncbi:hypothetical protein ABW19_dt0203814 [Dactylella cylindrospora]|nr:hypothetical protein ABW19_dt0203814 [Dactylella cylindrospora]